MNSKKDSRKNPFDLPEERLATTDETGARVYLYPADVWGKWRSARTAVYSVLIILFLGLPWLKINGHQALFLDVAHRKFTFFGLMLWAHEVPLLFLVLISFILTAGFVTALWGRVWCGWVCPQTVFIDSFFRRIERWVEGSAAERKRKDSKPLTLSWALRKTIKWILFLGVSLVITHSFLAYFVGTDKLAQMIHSSPMDNPKSFIFIAIATAIILFDFGWFREQFCVIACPYGRFQSVMMDSNSMVVAYDYKRGEPRQTTAEIKTDSGDCINCFRCVQVCPTGVDIRRGVQLECIMCTACIDACDQVMTKIGKPTGLIRYDSENGIAGKPRRKLRVRLILYGLILVMALGTLTYLIQNRVDIKTSIVRAKEAPYILQNESKSVLNHYKLTVHNQLFDPTTVTVQLANDSSKTTNTPHSPMRLVTPLSEITIDANQSATIDLFFEFSVSLLQESRLPQSIQINYTLKDGSVKSIIEEVVLIGP